jgi:hypothetical protein
MFVAATYGASGTEAVEAARRLLARAAEHGYAALAQETADWWRDWWAQAATIDVPDPTAALLYRLGLYKLGGLSVPGASSGLAAPDGNGSGGEWDEAAGWGGQGSPAASLQGPWVEEYRLPPWGSDFHFNVNVQECYWPAYAANHLETLDPLEHMLERWQPRLRENARRYVGVDDGLLLPHAVDDRGTCMGGFWTGQTDHGSTAWAAQLLWQRYRHTGDMEYLRQTAYPFLRGAMRTYEAMLEDEGRTPKDEGRGRQPALCLPVGVSPEFGGSQAKAWGRNPSFQLACIHFLCRALLAASEDLALEGDDQRRWRAIERRLPLGSIGRVTKDVRGTEMVASAVPAGERELLIWDGQPLLESHRHHSHLAALYPFGLLDPLGHYDDRLLVANSLRRLTLEGMGAWTGWCVPWAAILHARAGQGDMAGLLLEVFRRTYMGPGYYSTHDAVYRGFSVMANRPEIMQVEAALGAAAAVLELLALTNAPGGEVLRVFSGTPGAWRDASFHGVRAEGAFLLDAVREAGQTREVRVRSEAGGTLRLAHPFGVRGAAVRSHYGVDRYLNAHEVPILTIATAPGDEIVLTPA